MFIALPKELKDLRKACGFAEIVEADWDRLPPSEAGYDIVHGVTRARAQLENAAKPLMQAIDRNGAIWISWPKRASKIMTDITEDVIREIVLPIGLVDVKVAAVSDNVEVGSGSGGG